MSKERMRDSIYIFLSPLGKEKLWCRFRQAGIEQHATGMLH